MSNFNDLNSDLTPIGITFTAVSWLNIFGIVQINPLLKEYLNQLGLNTALLLFQVVTEVKHLTITLVVR